MKNKLSKPKMSSNLKYERTEKFRRKILMTTHYFAGYISVENAQIISGYTNIGAKKALKNLVAEKFLTENKISIFGTSRLIYRITKRGREYISQYSEYEKDNPYYETFKLARFRPSTFNHEMTVQRLAHELSEKLETDFYKAVALGATKNKKGFLVGGRRADAEFIYKDNRSFLEVELSMKSRKRYESIFEIYNRYDATVFWAIRKKKTHIFKQIIDELIDDEFKKNHLIIDLEDDY